MSDIQFPRTQIEGVSMPRMIMGTNWMLGYSHTSSAADAMIRHRNGNAHAVAEIAEVFLNAGVDAVMGPLNVNQPMLDGLKMAEDRVGKGFIRIDTPEFDVSDNPQARQAAAEKIADCKRKGADFCLIHHASAEQLVNKNKRIIDRLPEYLSMIRDNGMIPGLSAHMPEMILYSDENEYDVQTYIQLYNCMGFLMQVEIESVHKIIWNAKKPVMAIKPMAAGRCSPFVGITFSYSTLRERDMVVVGCMTPREAQEDLEIGMAAIERRPPDLEGRASPAAQAVVQK
ncbi:MAG: hypothetical protein ACOYJA_08630 [Christensenellales bacterium]|jgi:hypothetical protein